MLYTWNLQSILNQLYVIQKINIKPKIVLGQRNSHMEKNEAEPLLHIICKISTQNGSKAHIKN